MSNNITEQATAPTVGGDAAPERDLVWGAEAIGREINRTRQQVYHLIEIGALEGAVARLGHKTYVGSRKALHRLPFRKAK